MLRLLQTQIIADEKQTNYLPNKTDKRLILTIRVSVKVIKHHHVKSDNTIQETGKIVIQYVAKA